MLDQIAQRADCLQEWIAIRGTGPSRVVLYGRPSARPGYRK
jgi:hypothetical protein